MTETNLIVAHDLCRAIGRKNTIPWKLSNDLKFFKATTINHAVIMGRNTYDSIGNPLPKRKNVILSRNQEYCNQINQEEKPHLLGAVTSINAALAITANCEKRFFIGGQEIYKLALENGLIDNMYITVVRCKVSAADTYFPIYYPVQWDIETLQTGTENGLKYRVFRYKRKG